MLKGKSIVKRWMHQLGGSKPWTQGYMEDRNAAIAAALDSLQGPGPFKPGPGYGIGKDERMVEYPWFFQALPKDARRLLDAGSTLNHALIVERLPLDRLKVFISTLAPEGLAFWQKGISYTFEDLRQLSFRDGYFDCIAALSSLEHVGMDNTLLYTREAEFRQQRTQDYLQVVQELKRVLRPGGQLLATLPYGVAESFGWFQQFDRAMLDAFIQAFAPSGAKVDFYRYRVEGWQLSDQTACDDARYFDVHRGQPIEADKAAAGRAVACLTLVK